MNKEIANKTRLKHKIAVLQRQSDLVKGELEDELLLTRKKVSNIGKIALGIGGGLIFSAIVIGRIGSGKNNKKSLQMGYPRRRVYHRFLDQLFTELSSQATDYIVGVAKERLNAFRDKYEKTEDNDSEFIGVKAK